MILAEVIEPESYAGTTTTQLTFWPNHEGFSCPPRQLWSPASSTTSLSSSDSFTTAFTSEQPSPTPTTQNTLPPPPPILSQQSPVVLTLPGRMVLDVDLKWFLHIGLAYGVIMFRADGDLPAESESEDEDNRYLRLIRFSRGEMRNESIDDSQTGLRFHREVSASASIGQMSSTKLSLPVFIKLDNVCTFTMNEGYGILYVIDRDGWVWALSYA
ncbi:hypothetical protein BDQ17DRAFT_888039 [Cyathus striatus]|nr:hypothetical protein BDQ17DRAFT_888039 [Cyathus striatus]